MSRKRLTQEEVINRFILKHGNKYTYPKVVYVDSRTKVCITCPIHGDFWQTPLNHEWGKGCSKCGKLKFASKRRRWSDARIDEKLKDRYIIRLDSFVNCDKIMKWKCSKIQSDGGICGYEWSASSYSVVSKPKPSGCPKCIGYLKITNEIVDERLKDRNIVRLGDVKTAKIKIRWKCSIEGCYHEWEACSDSVLNFGAGCPKCAGILPITNEDIDNRLVEHKRQIKRIGNHDGTNTKNKIKWLCLKCNKPWDAQIANVLFSAGCPVCKVSKGEQKISEYLDKNHYKYEQQKRFEDCRFKNPLPFDFAIFNKDGSLKCLIEYDGEQHFTTRFQKMVLKLSDEEAEKSLKFTQLRDSIKTEFCSENKIPLLRIPYTKIRTIENVMKSFLETLPHR